MYESYMHIYELTYRGGQKRESMCERKTGDAEGGRDRGFSDRVEESVEWQAGGVEGMERRERHRLHVPVGLAVYIYIHM